MTSPKREPEMRVESQCVMSKLPARQFGGERECPQCGAMVRVTSKGRFWTHWRSTSPKRERNER